MSQRAAAAENSRRNEKVRQFPWIGGNSLARVVTVNDYKI